MSARDLGDDPIRTQQLEEPRHVRGPTTLRGGVRDARREQHRNATGNPVYFTTAFFHQPEELRDEAAEAGLRHEATLGVEGPGWLLHDLAGQRQDPDRRERIMAAARALEPSLLGVTTHLLAVARK